MGELRSAVDALAALDLDDLDNTALGELIVEVSRQHDRLDGIRHRLVGEHDRRLAWKADGAPLRETLGRTRGVRCRNTASQH